MFAPTSKSNSSRIGRKTFVDETTRDGVGISPNREPAQHRHNQTGEGALPSTGADKKHQLVKTLEEGFRKKYGSSQAATTVIEREVSAVVLGGSRVTPASIQQLNATIEAWAKSGWKRPTEVQINSPSTTRTASRTIRPATQKAEHTTTDAGATNVEHTDARSQSAPISVNTAAGPTGNEGGHTENGQPVSVMEQLRQKVLKDPEPEKVLGLIEEAAAELEKKQAREQTLMKQAQLRELLSQAEEEKRVHKQQELQLEKLWKEVVDETVHDLAEREQREAAEQKRREAEQRIVRERQMKEAHLHKAREAAEHRAYESYQLQLTLAQDELRKEQIAKELEAKRQVVKRQMQENLQALERKKTVIEHRRQEEKKAMEEYNAMVEAQDRAHREALAGMYARQGRLAAIADNKRKEELAREEEEKQRTLREFELARERLAQAEVADREAKIQSQHDFRTALDEQKREKDGRSVAGREDERRQQQLLQRRAREAEAELAEARKNERVRRLEYRKMLEQQMRAMKHLQDLKSQRQRATIIAELDALEGDEDLQRAVAQRLTERAQKLEETKALQAAQADAIHRALAASGLHVKGEKVAM